MQGKAQAQILWTSEEVDALTGGQSSHPWRATGVTISEKEMRPGDVFFASIGDDVASVSERGAAAVVVSAGMRVPDHIAQAYPIVRVPCAYEALRSVARAARERTHSLVVAVQGFEHRKLFGKAISSVSSCYEAGRHLSVSMAAMPHQARFSIFGLSPALRPDVVVIDRPSNLRAGDLFDGMTRDGVVLMNADDPGYIDVVGMAKTAGLSNILTYSPSGAHADAVVSHRIQAKEGLQATFNVLGEEVLSRLPAVVSRSEAAVSMMVAALTLAKLSDMRLRDAAWVMGKSYETVGILTSDAVPVVETQTVSMMGTGIHVDEAIFRVKNMVDTGQGRRTVVLDQALPDAKEQGFTVPTRFSGLDVVCASKKVSVFKNARKAIEGLIKGFGFQTIVPEVLTPGDLVIFRSKPGEPHAQLSETLRPQAKRAG